MMRDSPRARRPASRSNNSTTIYLSKSSPHRSNMLAETQLRCSGDTRAPGDPRVGRTPPTDSRSTAAARGISSTIRQGLRLRPTLLRSP
eukprot:scaffold2146_cov145-Isochrysis_galbana.AAC.3